MLVTWSIDRRLGGYVGHVGTIQLFRIQHLPADKESPYRLFTDLPGVSVRQGLFTSQGECMRKADGVVLRWLRDTGLQNLLYKNCKVG